MAKKSEIVSTNWTLDVSNKGKILQGIESVKQAVLIICTTIPGQDPLRPKFGCGAYEYLDKPINIAATEIAKAIRDALNKFEPRIENVTVTQATDVSQLTFSISYTIKNTVLNDQINITYGNSNASIYIG